MRTLISAIKSENANAILLPSLLIFVFLSTIKGDLATYTISDGVMVAIAVGGSSDSYGGNATVKSVDTSNRIINYITSGNELKAVPPTAIATITPSEIV